MHFKPFEAILDHVFLNFFLKKNVHVWLQTILPHIYWCRNIRNGNTGQDPPVAADGVGEWDSKVLCLHQTEVYNSFCAAASRAPIMRSQSICLNILFDRNLIKMVKINRFFTTVNYFQHDTSWEPSGESIHFFWKHVSWHLSTKDGVHSASQRKKQRFTPGIGHPSSNTLHGLQ